MTAELPFLAQPYAGAADLPGICDLINTCNGVDHLADEPYATPETTATWIANPEGDLARDVRLWVDGAGRVVAFGKLTIAPPDAEKAVDTHVFFRVHPDTRMVGLEGAVVDWAAAQVRAVAATRGGPAWLRAGMHFTTSEYIAYRRPVLEDLGFRPIRYQYKMVRPLDEALPAPQFPLGYRMQAVAPAEQDAWVEAFNHSFIDHWGHHDMTPAQHRHGLTAPHYRADGDLVTLAPDGRIAAFCRCEIDTDYNIHNGTSEGMIAQLGTVRGHRKIGLGRAMLLAGMHWLKAQGLSTAVLEVDAENPTGALRLYESIGFTVQNTTALYQKDL